MHASDVSGCLILLRRDMTYYEDPMFAMSDEDDDLYDFVSNPADTWSPVQPRPHPDTSLSVHATPSTLSLQSSGDGRTRLRESTHELNYDVDLDDLDAERREEAEQVLHASSRYIERVMPINIERAQKDWFFALFYFYHPCKMDGDLAMVVRFVLRKYLIGHVDDKNEIHPPAELGALLADEQAVGPTNTLPTPLETIRKGGEQAHTMHWKCEDMRGFYGTITSMMRFSMQTEHATPLDKGGTGSFQDRHQNTQWHHLHSQSKESDDHDPELRDDADKRLIRETMHITLNVLNDTVYKRFLMLVIIAMEPEVRATVAQLCPQARTESFWEQLKHLTLQMSMLPFHLTNASYHIRAFLHRIMIVYATGIVIK